MNSTQQMMFLLGTMLAFLGCGDKYPEFNTGIYKISGKMLSSRCWYGEDVTEDCDLAEYSLPATWKVVKLSGNSYEFVQYTGDPIDPIAHVGEFSVNFPDTILSKRNACSLYWTCNEKIEGNGVDGQFHIRRSVDAKCNSFFSCFEISTVTSTSLTKYYVDMEINGEIIN